MVEGWRTDGGRSAVDVFDRALKDRLHTVGWEIKSINTNTVFIGFFP